MTVLSATYSVERGELAGRQACVLHDHEADLHAVFVPAAGMVGASLRHRGDELLGQRGGVEAYAQKGSTMGIPLLHPWANRLDGMTYTAAGRTVTLRPDQAGLRLEEHGLPIHGLLGGSPYWELRALGADQAGAHLVAELDFGAHDELLAGFPFPHVVHHAVTLAGARLELHTTIEATGDTPVPVAFGFHPYLQLPGAPRAEWIVELPAREHLLLDERGIPTGAVEHEGPWSGPLGERTFDDSYAVGDPPVTFAVAAGARRVEVGFDEGYPYAQVFAPPDQELVCFEPMTAPVSALTIPGGCPEVRPGARFAAAFGLAVGVP